MLTLAAKTTFVCNFIADSIMCVIMCVCVCVLYMLNPAIFSLSWVRKFNWPEEEGQICCASV